MKEKTKCNHDFRYSHIEYPPLGDYSIIPPEKDVVVCRKCGKIIKTIMPSEIGDGGTNYPNIETFLN